MFGVTRVALWCIKKESAGSSVSGALADRLARFCLPLNASEIRLIKFGRFAVMNRSKLDFRKPEAFGFLDFYTLLQYQPTRYFSSTAADY